MSSGVKVNIECAAEYEKMKMKSAYRYITFKLSDNMKEIVVDETASRDATYEQLQQRLLTIADEGSCRYAAYDHEFEFNGSPKSKMVFIAWNPEGAKTKQKMVYTSSKGYLKKALQIEVEAQCTDAEDLSIDNITERASKHMRD